jgi:hypothetical protein
MKRILSITALLSVAMIIVVWAEDPTEKGVPTSPLTIYSGGFGVGASQAISKELIDKQNSFLKLSLQNAVYFKQNMAVFFDLDWFGLGNNYGADLGVDFIPVTGSFRPFIGGGVGAHYFDKSDKFGDNIGPSATLHAGFALVLTNRVQMRARVPYHVALNQRNDQCAGVEVGFLFSGRFKHIKKLNYN